MTEEKTKKRGWVKNAAIVFLAVLLVLTFFSNTIMNRSLPQVATVNVSSGTITAKIRGYGTVEAYEAYEVKLSQTRTVESVHVRVGDMVAVDDILFMLAGQESEELEAALKTLEDMQFQYDLALLQLKDLDFALEDRTIQKSREALAEAEALRDKNLVTEAELAAAKDAESFLKIELASLSRDLEVIKQQRDSLGGSGSNSSQLAALARQINDASTKVTQAQQALESAKIAYGSDVTAIKNAAQDLMKSDVEKSILEREWTGDGIDNFGRKFREWRDFLAAFEGGSFDATQWPGWEAAISAPPPASTELESDIASTVNAEAQTASWQNRLSIYMDAQATQYLTNGTAEQQGYATGYNSVKAAERTVADRQAELNSLQQQYSELISEDDSAEYQRLTNLMQTKQDTIDFTQSLMDNAQAELKALEEKQLAFKDAEAQVRSLQDKLETELFNLAQSKKDAQTQQAIENLNLSKQRREIEDQKERIAELQGDTVDSVVTAPVSGKITSLSVTAGNKTGTDALVTIELTDRGYLLSFSVTAEQAKKVSVGEIAEVSNYYWGAEIKAKLISVKNDPENPREKKLLTFDITGDVESGTQLNLTLGNKGMNYELVVPNSAIRTDNNGDFVLIYVTKQTPLGARYVATRVDVRVLEKDDYNSAVSGGLSSWQDYVITSSNKPLEPGMYVRLAEDAG
jgi:multidrug resistance efflux pump